METEKGLIHIICGDGKGKTTAATGLSIRAAGREKRVLIARFLKDDTTGENKVLKTIDRITVMPVEQFFGFTWDMNEEEKRQAGIYYKQLLLQAFQMAREESYDLLFLDEIMAACNYDFVNTSVLVELLKSKPQKLEVVMTGRNPREELCELADYISEINNRKHPMEKGIDARIGIEY